MTVDVTAVHEVHGVPGDLSAVFGRDPDCWLPEPIRHVGPGLWRFEVRAGPAHHLVVAEVGSVWSHSNDHSRSVRWRAITSPDDLTRASRLLPEFDGRVGLRSTGDVQKVEVWGHYRPPAGLIGAALDAAGMRRIAEATMAWLAGAIADRLETASR